MGESSIDPASPQINEHASLEHPERAQMERTLCLRRDPILARFEWSRPDAM